jgi:hypothetical protein
MYRSLFTCLVLCLAWTAPSLAQSSLPVVDEVEWAPFRTHCLALLKQLDRMKAPLPAETTRALRGLLDSKTPRDPQGSAAAVQKLLDPHCLIGVTINPESRVKAARGLARPSLVHKRTTVVLVRVVNEGGVTHGLAVTGPELVRAGKKEAGRWLDARVVNEAPFGNKLSGRRLEYRLMHLTPRQAGKREATLCFDAGQGSQDLGFRAEVPILFTVGKR